MFLILSKLLPAIFIDPIGLTLLFFIVGIIFAIVLRKRNSKIPVVFFICGGATLFIFSLPATAFFLMRGLEGQYLPAYEYTQPAAVVLLGGSTTGKVTPRIHVEVNQAGNRIFHGARVFKQSGAPYLVLTGGIVDILNDETVPEAYSMFELMHELLGIDTVNVILETQSRNTRENAIFTKLAMEEAELGNDIILVTSAYHMPRSVGIFKKAGFNVTPAPTGYFENDYFSKKPLTWLPNARELFKSSIAMREYWGILVYRMMGWI